MLPTLPVPLTAPVPVAHTSILLPPTFPAAPLPFRLVHTVRSVFFFLSRGRRCPSGWGSFAAPLGEALCLPGDRRPSALTWVGRLRLCGRAVYASGWAVCTSLAERHAPLYVGPSQCSPLRLPLIGRVPLGRTLSVAAVSRHALASGWPASPFNISPVSRSPPVVYALLTLLSLTCPLCLFLRPPPVLPCRFGSRRLAPHRAPTRTAVRRSSSGWSVAPLCSVAMAKSKNHTAHNQSYKAHRNGIKRPSRNYHPSRKGVRVVAQACPLLRMPLVSSGEAVSGWPFWLVGARYGCARGLLLTAHCTVLVLLCSGTSFFSGPAALVLFNILGPCLPNRWMSSSSRTRSMLSRAP